MWRGGGGVLRYMYFKCCRFKKIFTFSFILPLLYSTKTGGIIAQQVFFICKTLFSLLLFFLRKKITASQQNVLPCTKIGSNYGLNHCLSYLDYILGNWCNIWFALNVSVYKMWCPAVFKSCLKENTSKSCHLIAYIHDVIKTSKTNSFA